MSDDIHFTYDVKIRHNADLLTHGPLSQSLINSGEILITSKSYTDYSECETDLSALMRSLTFIESKLSKKKYAVVMKVNPLIDGNPDDAWDDDLIMQVYIIEEENLDDSTTNCSVVGQIKTNGTITNHP